MNNSVKKPLLILGVMAVLFGVGYLITRNLALSGMIAVLGTVIPK